MRSFFSSRRRHTRFDATIRTKRSERALKITLTVTGGFTGIGGKWEIDAASGEAQSGIDAVEMQSLTQLVAAARSAGVFGNDYSEMPRRGAARAPVERPD